MKKFQFIISYFSNLLFFAQKTNQRYLVKIDVQKYLADEKVNILFYGKNENKIWREVNKATGKQNVKQIKKFLTLLKFKFSSYWRKASKQLFLWKKYFRINQFLFQQIILSIRKLSGTKHFSFFKIPIYLISNSCSDDSEINAWFSWTPNESFIVIEIPFGLKPSNNLFPLGILAHEFFHLILKKNTALASQINKLIRKNIKSFPKLLDTHISNRMFLEELLISSFIPEGCLCKKYLEIKAAASISKPKNLLGWRKLIAFKLYKTAKNYLCNARQIDKKYIECIINIIKRNKNNPPSKL